MDGWPAELSRTIGMRISMLRSNTCASGVLLTVLPDVAATESQAAETLRRLPAVHLPLIEVSAVRHASTVDRAATVLAVEGVTARLNASQGCSV